MFTPKTLTFLRGLKRNNRREWFHARKDQYEAHVRAPMVALVERLAVDMRSFALNSEISLVLYDRDATLALRRIEDARLEQSIRLMPSDWESRNLVRKCAENVARLFSPLL